MAYCWCLCKAPPACAGLRARLRDTAPTAVLPAVPLQPSHNMNLQKISRNGKLPHKISTSGVLPAVPHCQSPGQFPPQLVFIIPFDPSMT